MGSGTTSRRRSSGSSTCRSPWWTSSPSAPAAGRWPGWTALGFESGREAWALTPARGEEAIRRAIAEPLFGGDVPAAADGIRRVAEAQMADLIRKVTIERGHDPRDFVLMAY